MRPLLLLVLVLVIWLTVSSYAAAQQLVNPDMELQPRTAFEGATLEFDFPALHIGIAEYDEGPTGVTTFYFPANATAVVDVRGGAAGSVFTDYLRAGYEQPIISGISFAGGSAYGLEAAAGVAAEILARRNYAGTWQEVAAVPGAIIFDLEGRRFNTVHPDVKLGRAAVRNARPGRFYQGPRGAGRFAMQGGYYGDPQHSGQGGAFRQVGPTKIAVFTVVNAVGTIVDRQGNVVRCSEPDPLSGHCGPVSDYIAGKLQSGPTTESARPEDRAGQRGPTTNTTITLVVTNQKLNYASLRRLAVQVHSSMARAIQPFHTAYDGDTLFAVTTGEVDNKDFAPIHLSVLASEVAWDAVLNSVPPREPQPERTFVRLSAERLQAVTGRYQFNHDVSLTIRVEDGRLFAQAGGKRDVYGFRVGVKSELFPTSDTDFFRNELRSPRIQFVKDEAGRITGLVLNPGDWPVPARRVKE